MTKEPHELIVTYSRKWFRKRYWARCIECEYKQGPFKEEWQAREVVRIARLIRTGHGKWKRLRA